MEIVAEQQTAEKSVINSWVIQLSAVVEEVTGREKSSELLERAGIAPDLLTDPGGRTPSPLVSRFYEVIVEELGDETIGLELAERLTPGSLHALGYSLFASRTLRMFFMRLQRFFRLISDSAVADVEFRGDRMIYSLTPTEDLPPIRQDAFVATIIRFARMAYRSTFAPALIRFHRSPPGPATVQRFEDYFCCPVEYGARRIEIHVLENDFSQVLRGANSELVRYHDQIAMEYLARFDETKIISRTQDAILKMLPDGNVSVDAVASALNVSSRSLQRRLQEEGTSFNTLLDDLRQYLAVSYLRSGDRSIKEISYLLGYADPSNFSRAFRRLTGKTPQDYLPPSVE